MSATSFNPANDLTPPEAEQVVEEIASIPHITNSLQQPTREIKGSLLRSTDIVRCLLVGPTLFFDTIEDKMARDGIVFYRHYSLDALYFSLKPNFDLSILDSETYEQLAHPIYKNLREYLLRENIYVLSQNKNNVSLWAEHKKNHEKLIFLNSDSFSLNDLASIINNI